jgi:hypothetical protein
MGRNCKVCSSRDVEEINRILIDNSLTLYQLEEKYGINPNALYRHKRNHLDPLIQEMKTKAKESAQKDYIDGREAANMILKHLPEVLASQKPSLKELIDVIKILTGATGDKAAAKDIVITWGIGAGDKGKIQIAESSYQPEGISDDDVTELERETEKRKTEKV